MNTFNSNSESEKKSELTSDLNRPSKISKFVSILLFFAFLAGIFFIAQNINNKSRPPSDYKLSEIDILKGDEKKSVLEAQLKEAQQKVNSLPINADASDRYTAYIRMAELQNRLGMFQEAISSVDKIIADRPNNSRVFATYAVSYKGLGDIAKAKENLFKAMEIDIESPEYWQLYFDIYSEMPSGELDAKYTEALKATTNNINIVKSYARFLEKAGNKEKAIIYWETARNVDPNNAGEYEKEIARLRA